MIERKGAGAMKVIIAVVVVIAVVLLLGWVTISRNGEDPDITVNTETIEEDTTAAVETTKEAAAEVVDQGKKLVEGAQKTDVDVEIKRDETP